MFIENSIIVFLSLFFLLNLVIYLKIVITNSSTENTQNRYRIFLAIYIKLFSRFLKKLKIFITLSSRFLPIEKKNLLVTRYCFSNCIVRMFNISKVIKSNNSEHKKNFTSRTLTTHLRIFGTIDYLTKIQKFTI